MTKPEKRAQPRRPRVALIVETSLASGRDILRGIARYLRAHGPWSVYHEPRALEEAVPPWLNQWQGDGIIARIQNRPIADAVVGTGLPVVDVLGLVPGLPVPLVHVDDRAVARLGADHLLERGFRHFGFCAVEGANWSDARQAGFEAIVKQAGCDCSICRLPPDTRGLANWEAQQDLLTDWVRSLPRPVGVMVCNDPRGQLVLEAARRAGAAVPEQMAVIGVDNDEPLCEISYPPLSSVQPDHVRVGYEGAALLDRMMRGETAPQSPVYVPPAGLVTRLSTDVLAIDDPLVATAVRFIREYACDGIGIDDIVAHLPLSRSTLQRRFRRVLGRSVHDEILRIRLRRVQELLLDTELPLESVADKAGFAHRQYLGEVFKARTGYTLAQYRARSRG
ncbi:MAG: DNA-binding transcriptional regulator [Planctomycetaceae bacterium]|nr:DNA-binding transcriptional regulator [Planctomycetaceae bacterium]